MRRSGTFNPQGKFSHLLCNVPTIPGAYMLKCNFSTFDISNYKDYKEKLQQNVLAAAPYPPYPRPLFLLNIFMTSSPWLSMKWKPRLKQRKNTALLDFSKICLHFILKIYFDSDLCGKEFCKSNFVFSDIEDTHRGCAHITVLWCQKLEFLSDTKLRGVVNYRLR